MDKEKFLSALEDIQADATELQAVMDPKSLFWLSLRVAELAAKMCEHYSTGEVWMVRDDFKYLIDCTNQLQEIIYPYPV
jgi:hypothetical protein